MKLQNNNKVYKNISFTCEKCGFKTNTVKEINTHVKSCKCCKTDKCDTEERERKC